MAPLSALLAVVVAAVAASAKPVAVRDSPLTLSIARRFNSTGAANILKADRARAKVLKTRSQATKAAAVGTAVGKIFPVTNVPITNQAVTYTANVGVGTPPTNYDLIVDTGSSNTWVGANRPYVNTSSSVDTGAFVVGVHPTLNSCTNMADVGGSMLQELSYGSGFFFGEEFTDTVTVGNLVVKNQGIGVATFSSGFDGVDGIIGLGPVGLTQDTTTAGGQVPTVVDNAFAQALIPAKVLGVSFEPTTQNSVTNGELTFGGVDHSKLIGDLKFV